ncbi:MAG: Metal-dependent hydrolase YbeY, involved in rRNA and/or ribosome maturation and assembly, partial [uncultured Thermomicrobiales bacterium]
AGGALPRRARCPAPARLGRYNARGPRANARTAGGNPDRLVGPRAREWWGAV